MALTAAENIDRIVKASLELVTEQTDKVEKYAEDVRRVAGFGATEIIPYTWGQETDVFGRNKYIRAVEPEVPTVDDISRIYETERDQIIALLTDQLTDFLNTYYPLVNDAYDEATAWLVNTITNGGTGIPATIEAQIWQRGRDRITTESRRTKNQIVSGIAARGYMVPPGNMFKRLKEVDLAALTASGENSTSISVKAAEMEIENIKFAIEHALNARTAALGAATDYIRALAIAPDIGLKLAETDSDVQARMISATADLYRARLSRDEIVVNAEIARSGIFQGDQSIHNDDSLKRIQQEVNGTVSAADVYGRTAQSALGSLNTVAAMGSSSFD